MIQIKDNDGVSRPAEPGERVRFRNGQEYLIGQHGQLLVERRSKQLKPGKAARKARRAEALARLRAEKQQCQTTL